MQLNTIKVSLDNPLACITLSAGTLKYFLNNQEYKNIRKISTFFTFILYGTYFYASTIFNLSMTIRSSKKEYKWKRKKWNFLV